jgi:hypothetical protein
MPLYVGASMIGMTLTFLSMQPIGVQGAAAGTVAVALILLVLFFRMPIDVLFWTKGVEGERKTAEYLRAVLDADYIVLYNRLVPGLSGDVDALVIGETGVFAIETKNWTGKLEVRNQKLFIGESDRTWAIEQLYREAIAIQIALGEILNRERITITPILCAVGGVSSSEGSASGVYVTNGKGLARFILGRGRVLEPSTVRALAQLAERRLRKQYIWEV